MFTAKRKNNAIIVTVSSGNLIAKFKLKYNHCMDFVNCLKDDNIAGFKYTLRSNLFNNYVMIYHHVPNTVSIHSSFKGTVYAVHLWNNEVEDFIRFLEQEVYI